MKRTLPLLLLALAACSREGAPAPAASAAAPATAYDLELAYGSRGALYLAVEEPGKPAERYLLRLNYDQVGLGTLRDGWQLFRAEQPGKDASGRDFLRVLKDPFLVLYRDGRFSVARVPHRVEEDGRELEFAEVRGLFKGEIVLDYAPKGGGPKKNRPVSLVPVRKFDFKLPSKDLM